HADGSYEVIHPYIDREKRTATFVLRHFSDFSFAECEDAEADISLAGMTLSYKIALPDGVSSSLIVGLYNENGVMTESRVINVPISSEGKFVLPESHEYRVFLLASESGVPLLEG
ncbi:MAG: hypothetical protein IJG50_04140, partial [Clostridia bacterium]|nr:hypothetical protein [Clostridia bacterium]